MAVSVKPNPVTISKGTVKNVSIFNQQTVTGAGRTQNITVESKGVQCLISKGESFVTTILKGGSQVVDKAAKATDTKIMKGGVQHIKDSGSSLRAVVSGIQYISAGGISNSSVVDGGGQQVVNGGTTKATSVSKNGKQTIGAKGCDMNAKVYGSQIIKSGGMAKEAHVASGGRQTVEARGIALSSYADTNGVLYVKGYASYCVIADACMIVAAGGSDYKTSVFGEQIISAKGVSEDARIYAGAKQTVEAKGVARRTSVNMDGLLLVNGIASDAIVQWDGRMIVNKGGFATSTYINGDIEIAAGGQALKTYLTNNAKVLVAGSGAKMTVVNTMTLKKDITVKGGGALLADGKSGSDLFLEDNTLNLGYANLSNLGVNAASNGTIKLDAEKGLGASVFQLTTSDKTKIRFKLDNDDRGKGPLLKSVFRSEISGTVDIAKEYFATAGTYTLANNISLSKNCTININGGSLKNNGTVRIDGVNYTLATKGVNLNLTMNYVAGKVLVGKKTGTNTLTGTANCDIFYGGKGKDTISAGNHDIVVIDKNNWGGKDVVVTSGAPNLKVMAFGFKSGELAATQVNGDLVIKRKGDNVNSVTIMGCNGSKVLVYGGTTGTFSKFAALAKPTAAQTNQARNDVWKKAGMLA